MFLQNKIFRITVCIAVIFLLLAGCVLETPAQPSEKSIQELTLSGKKSIAEYAYSVMDAYINGGTIPDIPEGEMGALDFDYENVFISLYRRNALLGCVGGSAKKGAPGRLFLDLKKAAVETMKDGRFVSGSDKILDKDSRIVVSFLLNKRKMERNDIDYLKKNIELGMHSVSIERGGNEAYFISSVPVTKNYNLDKMLRQLCKKAGFEEGCYLDNGTQIYTYDTMVYSADRQNNITDLYRFNVVVDSDEITQQSLRESISMLKDWFLNNVNAKTGLLEYMYYPTHDIYSPQNNDTRQLATLWALTELKIFFETNSFDDVIHHTFDHYWKYRRTKDDYGYIDIGEHPSIALNGFMIMAMLNYDLPMKDRFLKKFAKGILRSQQPNGSYKTIFGMKEIRGVDYFPGEAMLALMKLYEATKEQAYLDSVKKAFFYYRAYWQSNKNTAFVPWHTEAYYLLYKQTQDPAVADFIYEMNDWIIDKYQTFDSRYIDEIGGFPQEDPGGCSTAVFLEGINDAYALARDSGDLKHEGKYKHSILLGTRFILQSQVRADNSFYLADPKKAMGGIRRSLVDGRQRIDFTQHAVMALMKVYKNKVFK